MNKNNNLLTNNFNLIKCNLSENIQSNKEYKFLINLKIFNWNIKIGGIVNKAKKISLITN